MIELHFNSAASVADWTLIDDRVMGGVSSSQLAFHQDGTLCLRGRFPATTVVALPACGTAIWAWGMGTRSATDYRCETIRPDYLAHAGHFFSDSSICPR